MISVSNFGVVRVLTICRESRRNSIDEPTVAQLRSLISEANADDAVRAVVFTGEGTLAFCAGSDMKAAQELSVDERIEHSLHGQQMMDEINKLNVLTIAAVEGYALGGGFELALACDLIIAGESAVFGLPEVLRGTIPAWGGTFRLTKAVGLSVAKNLLMGGQRLNSDTAKKLGLVLEVVATGQACNTAIEIARQICEASERHILADAKHLLNNGAFGSVIENSVAEMAVETKLTSGSNYGKLP